MCVQANVMEFECGRSNEATHLERVKVVVYVVDYIDSIYVLHIILSMGKWLASMYYYNL